MVGSVLVLVCLLGISVTRDVVLGLPIGTGQGGTIKESEVTAVLSPVVHAAILYAPKNGSHGGEGNGGKRAVEGVRSKNSNASNVSVSGSGALSWGNRTGLWNGTVRVVNSKLSSSPADVGVHEGGVSGLMKKVSSSVKNVLFKGSGAEDYKIVMRNESTVVARVGRLGKWTRLRKVVPKGGYVVVGVEFDKGGNEEDRVSREYKIKTGGRDRMDIEDVHLVENEDSVEIVIGRSLKREDECLMKGGDNEIGGMICRCEEKYGVNTSGGVGCVTRMAERVMRATNEAMLCREKDGTAAVYECMIRKLEERKRGNYSGKGTGRWILSWSEADVDAEDFVLKAGFVVGLVNVVKYFALVVGIGLGFLCLLELVQQYGLCRQNGGRSGRIRRVGDLTRLVEAMYSRLR